MRTSQGMPDRLTNYAITPRALSRLGLLWRAALAAFSAPTPLCAGPVSFRNEVMAVLSRGGCNQGACHGNQNGKNGFKLSLRGEDPSFDYSALTMVMLVPRITTHIPTESIRMYETTASIVTVHGIRSCGSASGVMC